MGHTQHIYINNPHNTSLRQLQSQFKTGELQLLYASNSKPQSGIVTSMNELSNKNN